MVHISMNSIHHELYNDCIHITSIEQIKIVFVHTYVVMFIIILTKTTLGVAYTLPDI